MLKIQNQFMENIITFFKTNMEWIFSGIGVAFLVPLFGKLLKREDEYSKVATQENKIINNININNHTNSAEEEHKENNNVLSKKTPKDLAVILFIDDEKFNMVNILKKAGWKNTSSKKDIIDMDDNDVYKSDIIFVDINGVGKNLFESQGIGLASALKDKYPAKKIVIYSAETTGDRFDKALRKVDDCLAKNAEPYEFISLVETFAAELYNEQKNNI